MAHKIKSKPQAQRIYILGPSGSGKSYLAKIISQRLKIPHFDLDDISWDVKFTKMRSPEKYRKCLNSILRNNKSWVIEGVRQSFIEDALKAATQIVWLDAPAVTRVLRIMKRSIVERKTRQESFVGFLDLIKFALSYKRKDGHYFKHEEKLKKHSNKLVQLKSKREITEFVKNYHL